MMKRVSFGLIYSIECGPTSVGMNRFYFVAIGAIFCNLSPIPMNFTDMPLFIVNRGVPGSVLHSDLVIRSGSDDLGSFWGMSLRKYKYGGLGNDRKKTTFRIYKGNNDTIMLENTNYIAVPKGDANIVLRSKDLIIKNTDMYIRTYVPSRNNAIRWFAILRKVIGGEHAGMDPCLTAERMISKEDVYLLRWKVCDGSPGQQWSGLIEKTLHQLIGNNGFYEGIESNKLDPLQDTANRTIVEMGSRRELIQTQIVSMFGRRVVSD